MARRATPPVVRVSSSQKTLRVPRRRIAELVAHVIAAQGGESAEVDVAVVGREEMASLNGRFLGRRRPTDVLSFDLSGAGPGPRVAQIIVCSDVARAEAAARGLAPQHELLLYVVHGLLHLLGYDDQAAPAADRMHQREEALLAEFLDRSRGGRPGRPGAESRKAND